MEYVRYSSEYVFSGNGKHNDTKGQIGHGTPVKLDNGDEGNVIVSNWRAAQVQYSNRYGTHVEWVPNDKLLVPKSYVVK